MDAMMMMRSGCVMCTVKGEKREPEMGEGEGAGRGKERATTKKREAERRNQLRANSGSIGQLVVMDE
jgi:hypothetical protein